jgi:hypothetical protein
MFDTELDTEVVFTDEQKQHILENPEIREDLLFWFSCNLSEGWWSQENCNFMMGLMGLKIENNDERFTLEEISEFDLTF